MITKLKKTAKKKSLNDAYIIGSYVWAQNQMGAGEKVRRRGWAADTKPISKHDAKMYKPSAADKRSLDWEAAVMPHVILMRPAAPPPVETAPWLGISALVAFAALICWAALYASHYKLPF